MPAVERRTGPIPGFAATEPVDDFSNRGRLRCSRCSVRGLCLPSGLAGRNVEDLDDLVYATRRIPAGEMLIRAGSPFRSLYAIRTGFFKSYTEQQGRPDRVTGFQMAGEIVGLDGIDRDAHTLNVKALEDSHVCVIPYVRLEALSARLPWLRRRVHRLMSREIGTGHGVMMLLGAMAAEERVAAFLLNLSSRFAARGFDEAEFVLRMSREDIGGYVGLTLETVSRVFSAFRDRGLIEVQLKMVRILDVGGLHAVLGRAVL